MGTSLFNTTPAATYPALLKVGDNTSIDGTLKTLSDGAGNDLPIQVSSTVTNFTGNIGIGTTAPANKLSIKQVDSNTSMLRLDSASSVGSNTYQAGIDFYSRITAAGGTDSYPVGKIYGIGGSLFEQGSLRFQTIITNAGSLTDTMTLFKGNVGIGSLNTTPSKLLHVVGLKDTVVADFSSNTVAINEGVSIQLSAEKGSYPLGVIRGIYSANGGFSAMTFSTTNSALITEAIRINSSQQVGIGTQSPTARLTVQGSGSTSATTSLLVQNSSASDLFRITDDGQVSIPPINASTISNLVINAGSLTNSTSAGIDLVGGQFAAQLYLRALGANTAGYPSAVLGKVLMQAPSGLVITSNNAGALSNTDIALYVYQSKSVHINGFTEVASAVLNVESTTKGFLPPRMTTAERVAITTPADGLIVFDTDVQNLCYRRDSTWVQVSFTAV
jgi:hypothetical protein